MDKLRVRDKTFIPFITEEKILQAVDNVAEELNSDMHDKDPLFIAILNGAFMFASDLLKRFMHPCSISFVKLASYSGTQSTQNVKKLIGLNEDIKGRNIVIIEDIIDTGITMEGLLAQLGEQSPADIRIATMLFKKDAFIKDFHIDYLGITIPNDFIIGYGLDYDGYGRNYPDIYKILT